MTGAMGSHHSAKAQSTTWLTPLHVIDALGPFDLDPCGHPGWPTAERLVCLPGDGLSAQWSGRVWLNPPYDDVWKWLARLADDHFDGGTALIFARTETKGFVREVWGKAQAILFLHGRLHFHTPDGARAPRNSGAPSVLVAYGGYDAYRLESSGLPGTYVEIKGNWPS